MPAGNPADRLSGWTGLRHLTNYTGGHFGVFAGSYSPDGRWIILRFEDHVAGTFALYRMGVDGSNLKQVAFLGELKPRLTDWGARPGDEGDADTRPSGRHAVSR